MISIVLTVGVELPFLPDIAARVERVLRTEVVRAPSHLDPSFAYDASRNQYNSSAILLRLVELHDPGPSKVIGITEVDLYIPILTFVFGEAQLNGSCAIVSTHRLRNEFYGLPNSTDVLRERLLKELIHELGHTYGLIHCRDYQCVMHSSTYVEDIDMKRAGFCPKCDELLRGEAKNTGSNLLMSTGQP